MKKENKFVQNIWIVPFIITLVLLIVHVFSIKLILIDNITLILLCILIIRPLSLGLKKIKFGNFEAELVANEVKEIAKETSKAKENIEQDFDSSPYQIIIDNIHKLSKQDYIIALVKLRMELENIANKIYNKLGIKSNEKNITLRQKIDILLKNEIIDRRVANILSKVISVCNKAIHCEEIGKEDALSIIDNGTWLLEVLFNSIPCSSPINSKIIKNEECDYYYSQKYIVKTVIPYVENPKENVYIMTQEELTEFLDGYSDYAEFIIEISIQKE